MSVNTYFSHTTTKNKSLSQKKTHENKCAVDKHDLKRVSGKLSLSDECFEFILHYCKLYQIKKVPLISDTEYCIDTVFKQIYAGISNDIKNLSISEIEAKKHTLFMIIMKIEAAKRSFTVLTSTVSLTEGMPISYITNSDNYIASKIIENNKFGLFLEAGYSRDGNLSKPKTLSPIQLYFELSGGIAYRIDTRLIRYQYRAGKTELVVMHSKDVHFSQKRKYRRKDVQLKIVFQALTVGENEKTGKKVFTVNERKYLGDIINISAGGCRLCVKKPIRAGQYMQISSILSTGKTISASAIIMNSKKNLYGSGYILNTRFVRMDKMSQNAIFEFIYDYTTSQE